MADPGQNTDLVAIHANEDAIALVFAARHADTLRYCHDWGMWLRWDGTRWNGNGDGWPFTSPASSRARPTGGKATPAKASTAAASNGFQADPRLATVSDEWDADQWLLNTPGGTVDLRTGGLRPPSAATTSPADGGRAGPCCRHEPRSGRVPRGRDQG